MRLQLHPEAEEELFEAAGWYEDKAISLGDDLLAEVGRWLAAVPETPLAWPRWPGAPDIEPPIRRAVMLRFPFSIAYQAFEDRVFVLAFAHTSRSPFYWVERVASVPPPQSRPA